MDKLIDKSQIWEQVFNLSREPVYIQTRNQFQQQTRNLIRDQVRTMLWKRLVVEVRLHIEETMKP
jgi:hypothetical protein